MSYHNSDLETHSRITQSTTLLPLGSAINRVPFSNFSEKVVVVALRDFPLCGHLALLIHEKDYLEYAFNARYSSPAPSANDVVKDYLRRKRGTVGVNKVVVYLSARNANNRSCHIRHIDSVVKKKLRHRSHLFSGIFYFFSKNEK